MNTPICPVCGSGNTELSRVPELGRWFCKNFFDDAHHHRNDAYSQWFNAPPPGVKPRTRSVHAPDRWTQ